MSSGPFMTHASGAAEAAAVRAAIVREQKLAADTNLLQLRFVTNVASEGDEFMSAGLTRAIAEEECPVWACYDPLQRTEHIQRYPTDASHAQLLPMVVTVYTAIAEYMRAAMEQRRFPAAVEDALRDLEEISAGALVLSPRQWAFPVDGYPSLRFAARQLLFADSHQVKLFLVVVNECVPYDYFFYFF